MNPKYQGIVNRLFIEYNVGEELRKVYSND
jgi:hypothetical protein